MPALPEEPAWAAHVPAGVAAGLPELLRDGTLPARFTRLWRQSPSPRQLRDVDGTWISSEELEQRSRAVALRLLGSGLEPGDRLLLCGQTSADLVIAYLAALRAGLVVVPLNPAYTPTEIARVLAGARPAAAAVEDEAVAAAVVAASAERIPVFGTNVALPEGPNAPLDAAAPDQVALLVYTSGTTGLAKGAPLTHANLLSSATAVGLAWRWQPDDRLLLSLPLFHMHGLGVGINGSLAVGGGIELRPKFDAADVAAQVAGGSATLFFGVPAMYQRLAERGSLPALASLRLLVSGSAPLPAALALAIAAGAGQIPIERYGMTETVMLSSNPHDGPRKPGTVGLPLPGVSLRLADSGEVEVSGPNVIAGYWERPEADAEAFTADGWFRTGDLGELDQDGYLALVGRSKDLIISGGYNVHPREVEEALEAHPDVQEAAVIGRPSERWGEQVTAIVVAARPLDAEQLRAHAAARLAPYKVPKAIEFAAELPRNALGKLLRNELR
jgi:malonyl-CoA/methylmalonyl-CoA synthetase